MVMRPSLRPQRGWGCLCSCWWRWRAGGTSSSAPPTLRPDAQTLYPTLPWFVAACAALGHLSVRVPVNGQDEVAELSGRFNDAAERIEHSLAAQDALLASQKSLLTSRLDAQDADKRVPRSWRGLGAGVGQVHHRAAWGGRLYRAERGRGLFCFDLLPH